MYMPRADGSLILSERGLDRVDVSSVLTASYLFAHHTHNVQYRDFEGGEQRGTVALSLPKLCILWN